MGPVPWLLGLGALAAQCAAEVSASSKPPLFAGLGEPRVRGRTGLISNAFGDHMVLQWTSPRVYGWATNPGASVTVKLDGNVVGSATSDGKGYWQVDLPQQAASSTPHTITAEASGDALAKLSDVLFGDVFLCSGQSNMALGLNQAYGGQDEIAASAAHQDIRLFAARGPAAATPQDEFATDSRGWSLPDATSLPGFSAVCWFTARALHDRFGTPMGAIESSVGGTYVEAWSSPNALAACSCDFPDWKAPNLRSQLWNALVHPLVPMRLRGVLWYQGESNAGNPTCYSCSFPAMIQDWRVKFGYADAPSQLPFAFVQLAGWNDTSLDLIPQVRLSQEAALSLPFVGTASATDLGDPTAPLGSIHPRDKKDVGDRLAKVLAHFIWNQPEEASPLAVSASRSSPDSVDVAFGEPVDLRDAPACPVVFTPEQCGAGIAEVLGSDGKWHPATLAKVADNTVRMSAPGVDAHGARYAFANYPLCTVYSQKGLPALPFSFTNLAKLASNVTAATAGQFLVV